MKQDSTKYADLIAHMQFYNEPEVSWHDWFFAACFEGETLTALGEYIQPAVEQGLFIDLPCGLQNPADTEHSVIQTVTKLGGTKYLGIDYDESVIHSRRAQNQNSTRATGTMDFVQSDILEYLCSNQVPPKATPNVWYISGVQPEQTFVTNTVNQNTTVVPYLRALYLELAKICRRQDLVIINDPTALIAGINEAIHTTIDPRIALLQHNFTLARQCKFSKIYVFCKQ